MTETAVAVFDLGKWEPQTQDAAGNTEFAQVTIEKTFTGAVAGTSRVEMLTASNETSRMYVAVERFSGSVEGRTGSFVLRLTAGDEGLSLVLLPGSGTDELAGITGTADIAIDDAGTHTFTLSYELP